MSLFARKITSRVSDLLLSKAATNTCKNIVLRPENAEHFDRHRIQLFEMKVSRIFYKFDTDKDEALKFDDISHMQRQIDSHAMNVQDYRNLCAKLDAHPKQGLSQEQFQVMYKVGLRTLEKDYLHSFGTYPNDPHPEKPTNNSVDYWSILKSRVNVKACFRGRNKRGEPIVSKADAIDILRQIRGTNYISPDDRAIKILANMTYPIMLKELTCTNQSIVALLEGKESPSVYSESPRALYISGLPNSFDANGKYHMKHSPVHSSFPHYVCSATASISISFDQYQSQWIIEDKKGDVLIAYAKEKVPHPAEVAGLWRVLDPISNSYVQSGLLQVTHAASVEHTQNQFHHQYSMPERPREVRAPQLSLRPQPQMRSAPIRQLPPQLGFPSTVVTQSSTNPGPGPHFTSTISGPPAPPGASRQFDDPFNTSQLSDLKHQLQNQIITSPHNPPDTSRSGLLRELVKMCAHTYSYQSSHRQSLHSTKSFPSRPQVQRQSQHAYYSNYNTYGPGPYQVQKRNSAPSRSSYQNSIV